MELENVKNFLFIASHRVEWWKLRVKFYPFRCLSLLNWAQIKGLFEIVNEWKMVRVCKTGRHLCIIFHWVTSKKFGSNIIKLESIKNPSVITVAFSTFRSLFLLLIATVQMLLSEYFFRFRIEKMQKGSRERPSSKQKLSKALVNG